tara:strand:+ start:72 stop:389 length:318 start_codon:yes stop_codon:yes gene_type:complete
MNNIIEEIQLMANDQRMEELEQMLKDMDPSNPNYQDIKEQIEAEKFQTQNGYNMGGYVSPTNKMATQKFMGGGMVYNKPMKMNKGGEVSRGGRKSMQGLKFRGVK